MKVAIFETVGHNKEMQPSIRSWVEKTKDIHNYETLFSYAEKKEKSMSKEEQKKTVEDSVKKHIDTELLCTIQHKKAFYKNLGYRGWVL